MTQRTVKHLNFGWKYCPRFLDEFTSEDFDDSHFTEVSIPHTNCELPYNNFDEQVYQFESCYRRQLFVDRSMQGQQAVLHFEAVMTYARVFLNGHFIGEHKGGYTPFQMNVTRHLRYGEENTLVLHVDSRERSEIPPFGFVVDYLTYGGIYREVRLEFSANVKVENCHVRTRDVLKENKLLDIDLAISNYSAGVRNITINFEVFDCCYKSINVFSSIAHLDSGLNQSFNITQNVRGVALWDTDNPHLYWLDVSILSDGQPIDCKRFRFGFRSVEFKNSGFYLNGKHLKIRGLNRHQSYPYVGYAMPERAQVKDADILKYELGVNTVRLSHYPQSEHFLDRCDEIGLLVFDEIPGWQYIPDSGANASENREEWWNITLQHVEEMITRDWNHPSVFIWGVRINESEDCDGLYRQTNRLAKELDDTRPTGGVRCIENSSLLEDVYTYNDFSHNGGAKALSKPQKVIGHDAPYLVTEHNGHMFSTKRFDSQAQQLEHALRHARVLDAAYGMANNSGAIGWCMFDYNTHKDFGSGDRICYHGVMDMFRVPKYAAAVYASQQDDKPYLEIASTMHMGDYPGSELGNVYVFTNCDSLKLYKNDVFIQSFYPARDQFPHLPHAPIIIDNFIGNLIEKNESFSTLDSKMLKALLIEITHKGLDGISLLSKLKMLYLLKKNGMAIQDGVELYGKYVAGWGDESTTFRVDGYIGDKRVCTQSRGLSFQQQLEVQVDNPQLCEHVTWDTTRVVIKRNDENGSIMPYAHDALRLSTEGAIEIIGPKTVSLIGGTIAFWVRTAGHSGTAKIIVHSEEFGIIESEVAVVKQDPDTPRKVTKSG